MKFKYQVADVNKQIHIAFGGIKCVPGEYDQPHHEIISWYIQSIIKYARFLTKSCREQCMSEQLNVNVYKGD